jgi:hypothetical protein
MLLTKKNAHPRDSRIVFHEIPHIYVIDGNSQGYTSVTTLNHACFKHFNAEKVVDTLLKSSKRKDPEDKYFGKTREDILEMWNKNGKEASTAGTKLHENIEYYYNELPVENTSKEYGYFLKFRNDYPHLEAYRTEWYVFYEEIKLAGSIDMVFRNTENGTFEIYDWKRVNEIKFDAFDKNDVGLYDFLEDLPNTNFWHYTLQLNTYKKILEDKYDMQIAKMFLIVIHPDNSSYIRLEVPDKQDKIVQLFDKRLKDIEPKTT